MSADPTTIKVDRKLHSRLEKMKPFDSVSFKDLIEDMADVYEEHELQ